ncbi:response regulator transcription factor [Zhihengliuella flava]|uniref:DNA-binding response OmpR family regulator n=1 Tax=Zhihengliuella flava TaxID=1285193 RepID=A0A931GJK7_9MICC|nr:winged helix-turn-helix domain-containing protein [Zhihengliuella flava]MBG6085446.1 DNA-binding response OmpR family regulator [Zhihengliuella flava]
MRQQEPMNNSRPARGSTGPLSNGATVLVALPERGLQDVFESVAAADGFPTVVAGPGRHVVEMAGRGRPSLIVMSTHYRDLPAVEVIRRLRGVSRAYVVVLDRGAEEAQRIDLLDAGADQIIDATLSHRELAVRWRALLRRVRRARQGSLQPATGPLAAQHGPVVQDRGSANAAGREPRTDNPRAGVVPQRARRDESTGPALPPAPGPRVLESDGLRVDIGQHLAWLDGAEVHLTRTEFRILVALMGGRSSGGGRLLSKAELVGVIGAGTADRSALRSLEVHVGNLRRKLGERVREPRWIRTVRSVGYHWLPEVWDAARPRDEVQPAGQRESPHARSTSVGAAHRSARLRMVT